MAYKKNNNIMINLKSLILVSTVFIVIVLLVSGNTFLSDRFLETNNLKQSTLLEENKFIIPYVLRKYYSHIIDLKELSSFSSILTTSFIHENKEVNNEKELNISDELRTKTLKRVGLLLSIVLFCLIVLF